MMENEPAGGGATLSGCAERTPQRALDGKIEIGIVHHDLGVLAAELKRDALERLAAGSSNLSPTAAEPVNETNCTSGWRTSAAPTSSPRP